MRKSLPSTVLCLLMRLAQGGLTSTACVYTSRAILLSMEAGLSKDVQHAVLLQQHMAYQCAPCMVTVLSMEGCILTQVGARAWLPCWARATGIDSVSSCARAA